MRTANNSEVLARNFTVIQIPPCRMVAPSTRSGIPSTRSGHPSTRSANPSARSRRPGRRSRQRRQQYGELTKRRRSPPNHSCEHRNLTVSCRQIRQGRAFALGDSCFRRNGLWGNAKLSANSPIVRRRQMPKSTHTVVHSTDHSCVGRNLKRQRPSLPHLVAQNCEIPAYAGMVCPIIL